MRVEFLQTADREFFDAINYYNTSLKGLVLNLQRKSAALLVELWSFLMPGHYFRREAVDAG